MPMMIVKQTATMSDEAKAELINALTAAYGASTGIDSAKITVVIEDVKRSSWGVGGKTLLTRDKELKK